MYKVIVEVIPEALHPSKGELIQLSAIKIDGVKLIDRFDYRLKEENISVSEFLKIIDYDKEKFIYKNTTEEILNEFSTWAKGAELLILDNAYTNNFLESLKNKKTSIATKFGMAYHDDIMTDIIKKYRLEPSNYIVDLLYESLIEESNSKKNSKRKVQL